MPTSYYLYPDGTHGCHPLPLNVQRAMFVANPLRRRAPETGGGEVTSDIYAPDISKAKASRYIEAAQKVGACFDNPPFWSKCPDVPIAAFGYTPDGGGIDLNRLHKGDAFDAALAYLKALQHTNHTWDGIPTNNGPESYNAYIFLRRSLYPNVDEVDPRLFANPARRSDR